jgi:hypothetical protein
MDDLDALGGIIFVAFVIFGFGYWFGYDSTEVTPLDPNSYVLQKDGDTYYCITTQCFPLEKPKEQILEDNFEPLK